MSERRIRRFLERYQFQTGRDCDGAGVCARCGWGRHHSDDCAVRKALSVDPDAVAILHRWKEEAKKDVLMAAAQDRLENIVLDETGYRLTETGWEWVEGEGE